MNQIINLLIFTPLIAVIFNIIKIPSQIIWYLPILIMCVFFLEMIIQKEYKNIISKKNIPILIYIIFTFVSCITAKYKYEAFIGYNLEGFITLIGYLGFLYLGLKLDNRTITKSIKQITIVSTILSILMIFKTDISNILFNIPTTSYYFIQGTFDHFNHAGYYLLIATICSVFAYMNAKTSKEKIVFATSHSILIYTMILNDTFGVFVSYIVFLFLITIYLIIKKKQAKELLIIFLSFVVMSCITNRNNYNIVKHNVQEIISDTNTVIETKGDNIDNFGTGRGIIWKTGIKLLKEKPILGYGFENIKYEYEQYDINVDKPHNIMLELALSNGMIAASSFIIYVALIIIKNLRKIKESDNVLVISLLIVITYLISSLIGNQTLYVAPYFYFFLGVCSKEYYK